MLGRERTKDVARSRLGSVLREDRTNVSVRDLALMQLDVLAALSAYLEMERDQAHITVTRERGGSGAVLSFTVPVRAVKRRR